MNKLERENKYPYHNRELSWLDFNFRVLEEAFEKENPIMERLNFLSITASNLDEFFMVRVAGVMEQIYSKYTKPDDSGLTPQELMAQLSEKIHSFAEKQYSCLHRSILPALKKHQILFLRPEELEPRQRRHVDDYFDKVLFPVLTPLAVDTSRPFPLLANKSLNIAVRLQNKDESMFAVVQVPSILKRFLEVPCAEGRAFILLEDIITEKLPQLFELYEIKASCPFRVTRNSDLDIDEESADLMQAIEKSIKKRKRGRPVRLEILQKCDPETKEFLVKTLEVPKKGIYELPGPIDLTYLSKFSGVDGYDQLHFKRIQPVNPPADFWGYDDIFEAIREKDRMVHHPYESFDPVVKLVSDAASDPKVLAIKQTLYRVSGNSPIVAALARAAENGKQVTVLVELKARFDEENNIIWARRLEQAGCHVIYGLVGLKTHAKIILIVRKEADGIKRYVHLGTGNYNDNTAKLYTDMGLLTANDQFGSDASAFFNLLSGYSQPPLWNKLVMAPLGLRDKIYELIDNEIAQVKAGNKGHIIVKMNSLIDQQVIQKLYEASIGGVQVELIVRGICGLRAGVEGISENITVRSIVGRQLEHSRIFWFANGGEQQLYLSSADWMPRNLNDRVELFFPVESEEHIKRIKEILDLYLRDNVGAHMMQSNGTYRRVTNKATPVSAQSSLYEEALLAAAADKIPMEVRLRPMYSKDSKE